MSTYQFIRIKKYGFKIIMFVITIIYFSNKICSQATFFEKNKSIGVDLSNNKSGTSQHKSKYSVGFEGNLGSNFEVIILIKGSKPKKKIPVKGFLICIMTCDNKKIFLPDSTMIGCYINDGAILDKKEFNKYQWDFLVNGKYKAEVSNVHLPIKNNYELPKISFEFIKSDD